GEGERGEAELERPRDELVGHRGAVQEEVGGVAVELDVAIEHTFDHDTPLAMTAQTKIAEQLRWQAAAVVRLVRPALAAGAPPRRAGRRSVGAGFRGPRRRR